jgi:hypothetical protein
VKVWIMGVNTGAVMKHIDRVSTVTVHHPVWTTRWRIKQSMMNTTLLVVVGNDMLFSLESSLHGDYKMSSSGSSAHGDGRMSSLGRSLNCDGTASGSLFSSHKAFKNAWAMHCNAASLTLSGL